MAVDRILAFQGAINAFGPRRRGAGAGRPAPRPRDVQLDQHDGRSCRWMPLSLGHLRVVKNHAIDPVQQPTRPGGQLELEA